MSRAKVSLSICCDYSPRQVHRSLMETLANLGGLDKFISCGDKVLIKPNMIAPRPAAAAAQTDPAVIIEMAKILKDFGARPFVADSPAWSDAHTCAAALEMIEPLKKIGVEVKQLNRAVKKKLSSGTVIGISAIALEADKIINLPKLKTHTQLVATIAVKNIFGCVSGKAKAIWHFRKGRDIFEFCKMLIEIYQLLAPVVTIIDAVSIMEGSGPIRGTARMLGRIVASDDPVAAEILCCGILGLPADDLPIIAAAKKLGFGCSDFRNIKIVGQEFSGPLINDLDVADQIPLSFTLPRIIKSIGRQIYLKMKVLQK